jgi:hypothetical protein
LPSRLIEVIDEAIIGSAHVPPRTFFYSLPPIGVGTWAVESTTGYIARLAASHHINVIDVVAVLLGSKRRYARGRQLVSTWKQTGRLNGVGLFASNGAKRMTDLTGQKLLHRAGLTHLNEIFSFSRLLRYSRVWCPQCLDEMRGQSRVYELLLWSSPRDRLSRSSRTSFGRLPCLRQTKHGRHLQYFRDWSLCLLRSMAREPDTKSGCHSR